MRGGMHTATLNRRFYGTSGPVFIESDSCHTEGGDYSR